MEFHLKNEYVDNSFEENKIIESNYIVFQHKGAMYDIKKIYLKINLR
jgi:predicted transcriptional regulator YdeE